MKRGQVTACIKKQDKQTYCSRTLDDWREFLFTDADYALKHYKNPGGPIMVCEECAAECERVGIGKASDTGPMATRGLGKNDR